MINSIENMALYFDVYLVTDTAIALKQIAGWANEFEYRLGTDVVIPSRSEIDIPLDFVSNFPSKYRVLLCGSRNVPEGLKVFSLDLPAQNIKFGNTTDNEIKLERGTILGIFEQSVSFVFTY